MSTGVMPVQLTEADGLVTLATLFSEVPPDVYQEWNGMMWSQFALTSVSRLHQSWPFLGKDPPQEEPADPSWRESQYLDVTAGPTEDVAVWIGKGLVFPHLIFINGFFFGFQEFAPGWVPPLFMKHEFVVPAGTTLRIGPFLPPAFNHKVYFRLPDVPVPMLSDVSVQLRKEAVPFGYVASVSWPNAHTARSGILPTPAYDTPPPAQPV